MDIGFIGLGHMGFPMAARLAEAGHRLFVCDTRDDVVEQAVASGAHAASSPRDVADRVRLRPREPAVGAGVPRCGDRFRRGDRGLEGKTLRRPVHRRKPNCPTYFGAAWRTRHRDARLSGQRRRPRRHRRHTRHDGVGSEGRVRRGPRDPRKPRPADVRQREAGRGPDDETREQPAGGDGVGGDGGSGRDRREGGTGRRGR